MTIQLEAYKSQVPRKIRVFNIDVSILTFPVQTILYKTNNLESFTWNGATYTPYPLSLTENEESSSSNNTDKPILTLDNVGNSYKLLFANLPNLKGCSLEVIDTYDTYESTGLYIRKKTYKFSRSVSNNPKVIAYEMSSISNTEVVKLPRRQMLRDGFPNETFPGLGINKSKV